MNTTPAWRQLYNQWEKAASPALAEAAISPPFREALRVGARMNKAFLAEMERASAQWMHAWNLPAGSDVRRLRTQVRDLEKEIRSVRRNLETLVEDRTMHELNLLLAQQPDADDLVTDDLNGRKKPKKSAGKKK